MSFKSVADIEIVEKVSQNGYVYQIVRVTFANGKVIDLHCDAKDVLRVIYAING